MSFFVKLGFAPSERDKTLKRLIDKSYPSTRVVGRGTVKIDPKEVRGTSSFKEARDKASIIVKS
ncbi:hypothetical protein LC612_34075 [Nostoc sp. CHAB 5834]|nr:hypothetical protein [Nostoc sp. CHAB 5834]